MKRLLLIPTTVVTAFLAFAFLQPSAAGGVFRAVAPTVLAAFPASALSQADGSALSAPASNKGSVSSASGSGQASTQSSTSTGSLTSSFDPLLDPETKTTTGHALSTPSHTNCGRFGGGFHGGKHNVTCPNHPYPPPANQ
jgi:hypothetical protein